MSAEAIRARGEVRPRQRRAAASLEPPTLRAPDVVRRIGRVDVAIASTGSQPLAYLLAALPVGARSEPDGLEGLATLEARWLQRELVEQLAGDIGRVVAWAGWDETVLAVERSANNDLSRVADSILGLVLRAEPSAHAFQAVQQRCLAAERRGLHGSARDIDLALDRSLATGRRYQRPLAGTIDRLAACGLQDLLQHRRSRAHSPVCFITCGRIGPEQSEALLDRVAGWTRGETRSREASPGETRSGKTRSGETRSGETPRHVVLVDMPTARQAEIRVGHRGPSRLASSLAETQLVTQVLSRRLLAELRQARAWTYHAECRLAMRLDPGPMMCATTTAVDRAGDAAQLILDEIERLREDLLADGELRDEQARFVGAFLRARQTPRQLALQWSHLLTAGMPLDTYGHRLRTVCELDAQRLRRAARRDLRPQETVTLVAGPADALAPRLEQLARARDARFTIERAEVLEGDS